MTDVRRFDEATLLWAAAVVEDVDPAELAAAVDVTVLARIVADADAVAEPVDVAAAVLVGVVSRRPFPASNAAIGWLATTEVLAAASYRITASPARVVAVCDGIRTGAVDRSGVASALRDWLVEEGAACPVCGRRVYVSDAAARRLIMPGSARFELTARCAFEHGAHDRAGRPTSPPPARPSQPRQPVLARGACGSLLVAGEDRGVVVSPFCDDPPIARVVEVDEVRAGDLVGRWDGLVDRSTTIGFVPADDVHVDDDGCVDLARIRRALRSSRRHGGEVAGRLPELCRAETS